MLNDIPPTLIGERVTYQGSRFVGAVDSAGRIVAVFPDAVLILRDDGLIENVSPTKHKVKVQRTDETRPS